MASLKLASDNMRGRRGGEVRSFRRDGEQCQREADVSLWTGLKIDCLIGGVLILGLFSQVQLNLTRASFVFFSFDDSACFMSRSCGEQNLMITS